MLPRWREKDLSCLDQVANAKDSTVNLTPASATRSALVNAAWAPWLPGQAVPLIWERVTDAEPCDDL